MIGVRGGVAVAVTVNQTFFCVPKALANSNKFQSIFKKRFQPVGDANN